MEVAIGVQFEPLPLTTVHLGLLWLEYRDWLPELEEKPPLDPVVERFGVRLRPQQPRIRLMDQLPTNRAWFFSEAKDELVQIQRDRLVFNWRKVDADRDYPRYEVVEEKFMRAFSIFRGFLLDRDLQEPRLTQSEVTYVNHIQPVDGVWTSHSEAEKAVSLVRSPKGEFLPAPEDIRAAARFMISDADHSQLGRLHISLEPRFVVESDQPLLFLQLIARGAPIGDGLEGARGFFKLGRRWIVNAFVDVTTPEMQESWGRR